MKRITCLAGLLVCGFAAAALGGDAKPLDAVNVEELRTHAGQDVIVEGLVTDVGTTQTKSITFINLGLPKKQGFVAVVFQKNYGAFPDGFDAFKGQKVRVSGKLDLYQGDKPQIEVRTPEQIEVVKPE